jgi:GT2 family glycosyltransferase
MISVVIPSCGTLNHDRSPLLAGALDAAILADERIVVTTNNRMSPEGRRAIDQTDATVVDVQRHPFNFSAAVNAGVQAASGDDVVLLNDDVSLPSTGSRDWLAKLAAKRGHVVGVKLVDRTERRIEHAGVGFSTGGAPGHIGNGEPPMTHTGDSRPLAVTGAVMLVRRKQFLRLGGFDEAFPLNFNDVDFCLRALAAKLRVVQANNIVLVHRESSSRGHTPPSAEDCALLAQRHRSLLRTYGARTHHLDTLAA